jgi:hypothetical protein
LTFFISAWAQRSSAARETEAKTEEHEPQRKRGYETATDGVSLLTGESGRHQHDERFLLAGAGVTPLWIATRVENVRGNCITEHTAHEDVGSVVLAAKKTAHRN